MKPHHAYHVYQGNHWEQIVRQHFSAAEQSGLLADLQWLGVGVVGEHPEDVLDVIAEYRPADAYVTAPQGWEHVTLEMVRWHATAWNQNDHCLLYAHTKGAANLSPFNDAWRVSMTRFCVWDWGFAVDQLANADVAGCHWIEDGHRFFGGNFWWATMPYLNRLPELDYHSRYMAEIWIGEAHPRVVDLNPGWPDVNRFVEGEQ